MKGELLDSDLPEEQCMLSMLERAFPKCLTESHSKYMRRHQLKREIILDDYFKYLFDKELCKVSCYQLNYYVHIGSIKEYEASYQRVAGKLKGDQMGALAFFPENFPIDEPEIVVNPSLTPAQINMLKKVEEERRREEELKAK